MIEGVGGGTQGTVSEEHLHFLETVPVEGQDIDNVREGQ
jgi:hypothetical protein